MKFGAKKIFGLRLLTAIAFTLSLGVGFLSSSAFADADLASLDKPALGVIDQSTWLPPPLLRGLERVLEEHRSLTQETVMVAIVSESPRGRLNAAADALLQRWKQNTVRPPSAIVVLVDAADEEIAIRSGVGLDSVLSPDRVDQIEKLMFRPEIRSKHRDRAVVLSVMDVLRALESPVLASGEASQILRDSGLVGDLTPTVVSETGTRWWIGFIPGLLLLLFVFYRAIEVEAHYSDTGWTRVSPLHFSRWILWWRRKRRSASNGPRLVTGGGVSGSW